ncbi:hypothetical protein [Geomonas sp.]|uniref:hypothetical protein n=1 Tax=Geomonas sp. TaxID=2651584 RepID=UPI002B47A8DF|nr:hypothetical protein [Geomonas sp.]HJV37155.1 hypothetical protein [Geomonas sp.]
MSAAKGTALCCLLATLAIPCGWTTVYAADQPAQSETGKEMPVLVGTEWQALDQNAKITFVWGIGHVVTIEERVEERHPELKRRGFVAKLAEGLRGMPMNSIVQQIDSFYQNNPDKIDLPVMRVIWGQIVKPKLSSGIADTPLSPAPSQPVPQQ